MTVTERKTDGFLYSVGTAEHVSADMHTRDNSYAILRVAHGHFHCTVNAQEYHLSAGDIIFTIPGESCTFVSHPEDAAGELCKRQLIRLERGYLTDNLPDPVLTIDKKPLGRQNYIPAILASKYAVDIIFAQLHEYAASDRDEAETMLRLCSLMLAVKIGEILKYEYSDDVLNLKKNIKKITDYINENINGTINLDDIANFLYLDKSYVCRLFKRETGLTINTYINMTRVSIAKQMILDGTLPRDAYARCGYNDYSTFYRAFRRHAGMTPEEFKRGC